MQAISYSHGLPHVQNVSAKESGHDAMTRKSDPAEYNRQEQGRVIYRVVATIGKWRAGQGAVS
jgi:hypothetical protein